MKITNCVQSPKNLLPGHKNTDSWKFERSDLVSRKVEYPLFTGFTVHEPYELIRLIEQSIVKFSLK